MALLFDDLIIWIGKEIKDMAEGELFGDKNKIQEQMLSLQARLDMGEITEEEYQIREKEFLEKLEEIRESEEKDEGKE